MSSAGDVAELIAWMKVVAGLLVLLICVVVGVGAGLFTRFRRIEPTIADLAAWMRGVCSVRRVRETRRAQRNPEQRAQ